MRPRPGSESGKSNATRRLGERDRACDRRDRSIRHRGGVHGAVHARGRDSARHCHCLRSPEPWLCSGSRRADLRVHVAPRDLSFANHDGSCGRDRHCRSEFHRCLDRTVRCCARRNHGHRRLSLRHGLAAWDAGKRCGAKHDRCVHHFLESASRAAPGSGTVGAAVGRRLYSNGLAADRVADRSLHDRTARLSRRVSRTRRLRGVARSTAMLPRLRSPPSALRVRSSPINSPWRALEISPALRGFLPMPKRCVIDSPR